MSAARDRRSRVHCRVVASLLPVLPPVAVVVAQRVHPVGGSSSFLVRLAVLAFLIGAAEVAVLSHLRHRMPAWVPWSLLLGVTAAAAAIQWIVPSLPD